MHKSELRTHPTLINHAIKEFELKKGPLGSIGVLTPLESNFEIDSTSHYKESIALQYLMYVTTRYQVLRFVTYYPL